jgi:biotin transport system permease protein
VSIHSPLGAYLPGSGPLHRLRPGAKLLGLFGFAIAVVSTTGVPLTAAWLGIAVVLAVLAGLRGRDFWRVARGFALIAVPLFAFQAWQHGWERGAEVVGDLFAMILAASAVTASTAVEDTLDTITWALGPLRRLGAKPERVALAFSLVIRAIPTILGVARETQSAARARGLERDPRARLMPLVLRTVAHAQLTGEALSARGAGED